MKKLHEMPGYKRVPVTIVLHLYETVMTEWEDGGRFFIEENHCLDNYVNAVHESIERDGSHCKTCFRGAAFLGHIPIEAIRAAQYDVAPDHVEATRDLEAEHDD